MPSLEFRLFSGRPFYPDLEAFFLADGLENLVRQYGENDPLVKKFWREDLRQPGPGSGSRNQAGRYHGPKKLYAGGERALQADADPLLDLATMIGLAARAARKIDDTDDEIKAPRLAKIYQARVDLKQAPPYPYATGTLRLAYGTVAGYRTERKFIEPTVRGAFARSTEHHNQPPLD